LEIPIKRTAQNQWNQSSKKKKLRLLKWNEEKETGATFIVNEDLLENEIVGLLGWSFD
jgi:hypothetical protein